MITSAERVIEVNNASPQESANRAYGLAEGASNTKSTNGAGVPSTQSSVVLRVATLHLALIHI